MEDRAAFGKVPSYAGNILGKTSIGSAVGKVFTEAVGRIGAVRQGIRGFESCD